MQDFGGASGEEKMFHFYFFDNTVLIFDLINILLAKKPLIYWMIVDIDKLN